MSIDVILMRFEIYFEFVELHSTSLYVPLLTMTKMIKLMIILVIPS